MTNDADQLRATLARLRTQLAQVEVSSPEAGAQLRQAMAEIEAALETRTETDAPPKTDQSVTERLRGAAEHFEGEHPVLATTIGSIIDTLGRIGI